jgi:hypothetical protein
MDVNPGHVMIDLLWAWFPVSENLITASQIACQLNFFLVGEN